MKKVECWLCPRWEGCLCCLVQAKISDIWIACLYFRAPNKPYHHPLAIPQKGHYFFCHKICVIVHDTFNTAHLNVTNCTSLKLSKVLICCQSGEHWCLLGIRELVCTNSNLSIMSSGYTWESVRLKRLQFTFYMHSAKSIKTLSVTAKNYVMFIHMSNITTKNYSEASTEWKQTKLDVVLILWAWLGFIQRFSTFLPSSPVYPNPTELLLVVYLQTWMYSVHSYPSFVPQSSEKLR